MAPIAETIMIPKLAGYHPQFGINFYSQKSTMFIKI
jgi:hypothetical protein